MKEEFEIGQQVVVGNNPLEAALRGQRADAHLYYYLVTLSNGAIAVRVVNPNGSDYVECFQYVTAMPDAPIVTPFTHKTFPRGLVYVREKDSPALVVSENLVLGIRQNTIATSSGSPTYAALLDDYELTFEGSPGWLPCGVME